MSETIENSKACAGSLERMVRRLVSVVKHTEKPLQTYWTILLLPASRATIGICLRLSASCQWTRNGVKSPLLQSRQRVWSLCLGAWMLWLYKNRINSKPPNDPSSATRRTGREDCQPRRHAGFAAAHG